MLGSQNAIMDKRTYRRNTAKPTCQQVTSSETMNSCFREVFWRTVFCYQRLKSPLFSGNIKIMNLLNGQLHGEALCYRHYLLQYFQLAAPKEILFSSLSLHVYIPETIHKLNHPHCGEGTWEKGKHLYISLRFLLTNKVFV